MKARRYAVGVVAKARWKCARRLVAVPRPVRACDLVDGDPAVLEQGAGGAQPLLDQPRSWAHPEPALERAVQRTAGHHTLPGKVRDGDREVQVAARPRDDPGQLVALTRNADRDELGLTAGAVQRCDHVAGPLDGGSLPVVAADEVEAHVQTGGESGAGDHLAFVDVQRTRVHDHQWMLMGEGVGVRPVGRRAAPSSSPAWASAKAPGRRTADCGRHDGVACRSASRARGGAGPRRNPAHDHRRRHRRARRASRRRSAPDQRWWW